MEIPGNLAAPARRALNDIKIEYLEDITKHTRYEIENLHGIGKNALKIIEISLANNSLEFRDEQNSPEVDEYIEKHDGSAKDKLFEIRKLIRSLIPKAKEKNFL